MLNRRSLFRPLGLAVLLGMGAGIVWAVLLGIAQRSLEQLGPKPKVALNENLMVGSDGTVLISSYFYYPYRKETFRTLDGREIEHPLRYQFLQGAELLDLHNPYVPFRPYMPFMVAQRRVTPVLAFGRPPAYWYFVHDGKPQGRGYFVGFHADSKRLAGYLGAAGFRDDVPSADEQVPVDLRQVLNGAAFPGYEAWGSEPRDLAYAREDSPLDPNAGKLAMISDDRLLEIDFRTGKIRELLKSAGMMSANYLTSREMMPPVAGMGGRAEAEHRPLALAVRTPDHVHVWERTMAGQLLSYSYPIPADIRDLQFISFYLPSMSTDAGMFIATRQFADRSPREEIFWVDAAGKVTRQAEVELAGRGAPPRATTRMWLAAVAAPAPIATGVFAAVLDPRDQVKAKFAEDYPSALADSLRAAWMPLVVVFVLGGALAWLTYRRQRAYALPWMGVWAAFVFLAGVPGFIAYLWHRRWPVRQACPTCGQTVPRDREACSHCGEEFSAPAPRGVEVFAQ
jgi:hypothetical protein